MQAGVRFWVICRHQSGDARRPLSAKRGHSCDRASLSFIRFVSLWGFLAACLGSHRSTDIFGDQHIDSLAHRGAQPPTLDAGRTFWRKFRCRCS